MRFFTAFLLILSITTYGQELIPSCNYKGWKISNGTQLITDAGDTLIVGQLALKKDKGKNEVYAKVKKANSESIIPLRSWIEQRKIVFPETVFEDGYGILYDPTSFRFKLLDTTIEADKQTLYRRAQSWVVSNYRSAKDVIQLEDQDGGRIIIKGYFKFSVPDFLNDSYYQIYHQITIDVKDNKFRLVIDNFNINSNYSKERIPLNAISESHRPKSLYKAKIQSKYEAEFLAVSLANALRNIESTTEFGKDNF